jgi:hypothetical protein
MIRGHKPSFHFQTFTGEGHKVEGEGRQCVHCGYSWEYRPGSGIPRGYCLKCDGYLCARHECELLQRRLLQQFRLEYGCVPYNDVVERQREAYAHDPRYRVLPSGVVVAIDLEAPIQAPTGEHRPMIVVP